MVPNWTIFKSFSAFRGAKIAQHVLKMGSFHFFVHPQIVQKYLWKTTFLILFFLLILVLKQPIFKASCDCGVACSGLKMGSFHLLVHPKWCRIIFGKPHF